MLRKISFITVILFLTGLINMTVPEVKAETLPQQCNLRISVTAPPPVNCGGNWGATIVASLRSSAGIPSSGTPVNLKVEPIDGGRIVFLNNPADNQRSFTSLELMLKPSTNKYIYLSGGADEFKSGSYTYRVTASDYTGSTYADFTLTVLDNKPPTIAGSISLSPTGWYNNDIEVSLKTNDNVGLQKIEYTLTDSTGRLTQFPNIFLEGNPASDIRTFPISYDGIDGKYILEYKAYDTSGNSGSGTLAFNVDKTGPILSAVPSAPKNKYGWYNSDVTVQLSALEQPSEAKSGVKSLKDNVNNQLITELTSINGIDVIATNVKFSNEGANQSVTGTAIDNTGNVSTITVSDINIDKTPPNIIGKALTEPNSNGWYKDDVTISFITGDNLSGIESIPDDMTVSTEGANQIVEAQVYDRGGNVSSNSVYLNIDKSAPSVKAIPLSAGAGGWYRGNVDINLAAEDNISGLYRINYKIDGGAEYQIQTSNTTDIHKISLQEEGNHTIVYWAEDKAGNSSVPQTFNAFIDNAAPLISGTIANPSNPFGWYKENVTVHFDASDAGSGLLSVTEDKVLSEEGLDQSITGIAVDKVGNTSSYPVNGINIDKTAPALRGSITSAPNSHGWYNHDVTVQFSGEDSLSGLAYISEPQSITTEGTDLYANGTAEDKAGNRSEITVGGIKIDKTAPSVSADTKTNISDYGWYNNDITVALSGNDNLSGINEIYYKLDDNVERLYDSLPGGLTVSGEGNHTLTYWAIDNAGNKSQYYIMNINIDITAPAISYYIPETPNSSGWYNEDVTIFFTTDNTPSDLAYISPTQTLTEGINQKITGTALDKAGNSSDIELSLNIDKTPPTVAGAITTPPNNNRWYNSDVTIQFNAEDTLSGIALITPDQTITTEGANQLVTGTAIDIAGNKASTDIYINLDKTDPAIEIQTDNQPNADGWFNTDVKVSISASDSLSGLAKMIYQLDDYQAAVDTTGSALLQFSEEGTHKLTCWAIDRAGNLTAPYVRIIKLDKAEPNIIVSGLSENSVIYLNESITARAEATDGQSGISAASDNIYKDLTIDTQTPGNHTLIFTASDNAGNIYTKTINYSVQYKYSGLLQPITGNGLDTFKLGSTIPVKLRLFDSLGNNVGNSHSKLFLRKINSSVSELEGINMNSDNPVIAGNSFRYNASDSQYIFNLSTKGLTAGTYEIIIDLGDSSVNKTLINLK